MSTKETGQVNQTLSQGTISDHNYDLNENNDINDKNAQTNSQNIINLEEDEKSNNFKQTELPEEFNNKENDIINNIENLSDKNETTITEKNDTNDKVDITIENNLDNDEKN